MQANNVGRHERWSGRRRQALVVAAGMLLTNAGAAAEEMLVVGSSVPGLAPGDVAPSGQTIDVPPDSEVTLVAPSGGVLKIVGPWSGRIDAPEDDGGPGLIQRLYALFQMPDRRARFGATRSLSRCVTVDLDQDQNVCVAEPSCVVFQSDGTPQAPVTMTGPGGTSTALTPSLGAGSWRWPGDLIRESGSYTVQAGDGQPSRTVAVHLQPELPSRAHEIAWMGETGCVRQAQEALAALVEE